MAEPRFEDVENWLLENPDKAGTSDYVHMTSAYKALDPQRQTKPLPPTKTWGEDMWGRAKLAFGMSPGEHADAAATADVPNLEDIMAAKRLTSDPYSAGNTADRVLTGAIGGIPDLAIGGYNAVARTIGNPESQIAPLTPQMLEQGGAAELPPDAPMGRRLLEAGGSAFLGGGAGAAVRPLQAARTAATTGGTAVPVLSTTARMAAPTVVPTLTSAAGGEAGAALGRNFLGDEETGRYLGSLLGGSAMAVGPATRSVIDFRYGGKGRPDARAILEQAQRQGVTPTAGMLGNESIMRREQQLSGMPGSADVIQGARTGARTQIGNAYDRAAAARGSTDVEPTPGTIGYDVADIARRGADDANVRSSRGQQELMDLTGPQTDLNAGPIEQSILRLRGETDPLTAGPLEARLQSIRTMIQRNPANYDVEGNQIASNIRYQQGKSFRTNLRESGEGFRPMTGHHADTVYEAATDAMRDTAAGQGVSRDFFDTTQGRTAALTGEGGPVQTLEPISNTQQPMPAYNFLRQGEQAPGNIRTLLNTGIGDVARVLGDYMRMIGNETINRPGARGPANLADRWGRMTPEAREAIAGPQLGNVADTVGLSRALDIPTQQTGLTRAIGGQGDAVANKVIGSEALGQAGQHLAGPLGAILGRILGVIGPSGIRSLKAGILEGPTARNAMVGGPPPMGINQLGAGLTAAQAENRAPLQITVHPSNP